jgi:integrase
MKRRFQRGSLLPRKRRAKTYWYAQWSDNGVRKCKELGLFSRVTKGEAWLRLAAFLEPINRRIAPPAEAHTFDTFVEKVFLPLGRRKNKASTVMTTEQLIKQHLLGAFGETPLDDITRPQLQELLDGKGTTYSRGLVAHLRWQLHGMWRLAASEGIAQKNVADSLYIPDCQPGRRRRELSAGDVPRALATLDLRERLIVKLAIVAGMRPGEILALQWRDIGLDSFAVRRRIYRGDLDTPKTTKSARIGAMSSATIDDMKLWREVALDPSPAGWVFPSERGTPLSRDNLWRRIIQPAFQTVGLGWVNFQVMRRANASLSRNAGVDDKISADQRGHSLGVSLDVYATSDLAQKKKAVRMLESTLIAKKPVASERGAGKTKVA